MDRLQNSDSFGFKVQGAHFLKPNAVTQAKRNMGTSGNVFQASHKDAAHFVSMSSSKFGANILGKMNSVEQVNAVNQGDFSGYMNDQSAGHRNKVSQKPTQKISPQNDYSSNFINQFDLTSDDPNLFSLIGVQKLQLGHEDKPIPVNYDKKKARKKFDSKSPTQEGVEQPKISNQHVVVANDASFFSQPK